MEGSLCSYVGRWWGAGHDRLPTDIDVVGLDDSGKKAVIGECKFKNEIPDKGVYDDLMNKKGLIGAHYTETSTIRSAPDAVDIFFLRFYN